MTSAYVEDFGETRWRDRPAYAPVRATALPLSQVVFEKGIMAKILFNISRVLLLVLLVWHVLAAIIWGNWDQEGTGSLGFWPIFSAAVDHLAWLYGVLIVTTVVSWVFSIGSITKRNTRPEQSAAGEASKPARF